MALENSPHQSGDNNAHYVWVRGILWGDQSLYL